MTTCPPTGIYPDATFEDYLAWPAVNNSSLTELARSPAHFRHATMTGRVREETKDMRLGTLCHAGRFEPLALIERYAVMPAFEKQIRKPDGGYYDNPKASAAYKAEVAEWKESHRDKTVVEQAEYDRMLGVVKAIDAHPRARSYLVGGQTEVSIVWSDPETGITCKARIDYLNEAITDLKTGSDFSDFSYLMRKRQINRQLAFYQSGVLALTGELRPCRVIAAETSDPWCVLAAPLSQAAIDDGRLKYRYLLGQLLQATQAGVWPGYESPLEWDLPGSATVAAGSSEVW